MNNTKAIETVGIGPVRMMASLPYQVRRKDDDRIIASATTRLQAEGALSKLCSVNPNMNRNDYHVIVVN